MAKILISDDHPFILMGTKVYLEQRGHHVCEVCSNGINAYNLILHHNPDIALLDMSMPGMNGLEVLEKLQTATVRTKVIVLTMHKELTIFNKAKALNVKGYVLKEFSTDVLEDCVNAVLSGSTWFSKELTESLEHDLPNNESDVLHKLSFAEKRILELVAQQHSTKEIANMLFISEKTVENHRSNIIKKLGLPPEKNALLKWAIRYLGQA